MCRVHIDVVSSKTATWRYQVDTMTTRNGEKMAKSAEAMTRGAQQSGQVLSGYLVEVQEINISFARKATETWIEAFRKQTELNQRMVQRLYGEAEGQTHAFQELARDWMSAYSMPLFNPFGFWGEGMQSATQSTTSNVARMSDATREAMQEVMFPIVGYDEMNVSEITEKLRGLSVEELKRVRDYERRNKNRETVLERIEQRINALTS
jgi:hypothetical protein